MSELKINECPGSQKSETNDAKDENIIPAPTEEAAFPFKNEISLFSIFQVLDKFKK